MTPRKTSYLFAGIWANNVRYPETESKPEESMGHKVRGWLYRILETLSRHWVRRMVLPMAVGSIGLLIAGTYMQPGLAQNLAMIVIFLLGFGLGILFLIVGFAALLADGLQRK